MLNTAPNRWELLDLMNYCTTGEKSLVDGTAIPARPFGYYSLRERLSLAWVVFTGRADALFWHGSMPKAY